MLKTSDAYLLSKIVDKLNINLEGMAGKEANELGMTIVMAIVKGLHKVKDEVGQLLSSMSGKSVKEIDNLPLKETIELVKEILKEEGLKDFLSFPNTSDLPNSTTI
jgi:hypothetical protein